MMIRRRPAPVFVFLTLVTALFFCYAGESLPRARASKQSGPSLDHFKTHVTPDIEDEGRAVVELVYKGRTIYSGNEFLPDLKKEKRLHATPLPNSESVLQELFTGGPHCCFTNLLWTVSGSQEMAFAFKLEHSDTFDFKDIDGNGSKEIVLFDWSFAYYNSESSSSLFLPFASSPGMSRIMVFEGSHWRADRPGEFKAFYQKLLDEARREPAKMTPEKKKEDTGSVVYRVLEIAYYSHMAGRDEATVMKLLRTNLPPAWKGMARQIFSDIRKSGREFDPVEKLL